MNISDMIKNTADQIIEPEADALEHIRDFSSLAEHLQEAENDYEEAMKTFRETNPGSRYIMDIAAQTEEAAKALISRALAYFTHYQASQEDKQRANQIIDRVTKDASIREMTCSQYYRFMKEANPDAKELIAAILKEKQKIMHFLDRCIRTQSIYLKKFEKSEDYVDPKNANASRKAADSARRCPFIRNGSRWMNSFPKFPAPISILSAWSRIRRSSMSSIRTSSCRRIT